ncbi:hypothetical protein B0H14DRAFT_3444456 [Mycena olivaceomarginata]|nr:hypothetical protein B0H14DRAFT_3444456 [Mycena olivaceomarginata]
MEGEKSLRVVLKTYAIEDINLLIHEFDVYAAIAHLAVIVPTLHAVVKPHYDPWGGLILENAGTVLSEYEIRRDDLGLTHQEKILLYNTLRRLHSAGVVHGDVAAAEHPPPSLWRLLSSGLRPIHVKPRLPWRNL